MAGYLLLVATMLGLMVAIPFWDPDGFGASPPAVLALLAAAALVAAVRGRDPHGR